MRDYAITTDSSCDFDQTLADSLGVTVVPLSVQIGPDRFRNAPGEAMDPHTFYTRLSQGELSQTSAPNVEDFKAAWRPILQSGRDLLYLGFSSGLSGTYHNGTIAAGDLREEFPQARIVTVDTLAASLGQGMLIDLAVQEKRRGKTLDEVAESPAPLPLVHRGRPEPAPPGRPPLRREGHCGEPLEHQACFARG